MSLSSLFLHGCSLPVACHGAGQPVILLHGSASAGAQWRDLAEQLGRRFRVLAPDLWGWGAAPAWPGACEFSLAQEAAVVHALLDQLGQPAHLVGHSYGGATALHAARSRAGDLLSLTLIEPAAFHLLRDGDEIDQAALRDFAELTAGVTRAAGRGDYLRGFGFFVDYWNGFGTWDALSPERRTLMARGMGKLAIEAHATLGDLLRIEDFPEPAVPTLLVRGSRTTLPARRVSDRLARAWPGARQAVIEGAGHMAPFTHRREVNDLIAAHVTAAAGEPVDDVLLCP